MAAATARAFSPAHLYCISRACAVYNRDEMDGRDDEHIHLVSSGRTQRLARRKRREVICYCAVAMVVSVVLLIGLGLAIAYGIPYESTDDNYSSGTYKHAAVAADAPQCSKVGVDILKKDGSAVDAAIASLLCVGVVNFHSTGIGGGGFMVYYNATSKTATTFDYRETAPGRANSSLYKPFGPNENASLYGGLAIAVPGELRGLELAHRKFGKLSWDALFQPAAQIADEGFAISSNLAKAIQEKKNIIINGSFKGLQDLLAPGGVWLEEGDVVSRKKYAQTLRDIGASGNASYFYEGSFMEEMVKELQNAGAIIEEEDFLNYSAIQRDPVESEFGGLRVIGVPPPSSGAVLALILNILHGYDFDASDFGSLSYHRIVESFKFAYGQRLLLGDPAFNGSVNEVVDYMLNTSTSDFMRSRIQDNTTHNPSYYQEPEIFHVPSPFGTSHLCVLAPNGDAVAATSTINDYFGSLVRSETNGIIFNDEMDDFSIPSRNSSDTFKPTVPNYIEPRKRPQSSTTPTILLDGDKVKMVVGASGGSKITTATAQVILDVLNFDTELSDAIPYPRLHHQLYPNYVAIEEDFPEEYQAGLRERGQVVKKSSSYAVVQGIVKRGGDIHATCDPRKGGKPDGY